MVLVRAVVAPSKPRTAPRESRVVARPGKILANTGLFDGPLPPEKLSTASCGGAGRGLKDSKRQTRVSRWDRGAGGRVTGGSCHPAISRGVGRVA